jgi:hypothetical protein
MRALSNTRGLCFDLERGDAMGLKSLTQFHQPFREHLSDCFIYSNRPGVTLRIGISEQTLHLIRCY